MKCTDVDCNGVNPDPGETVLSKEAARTATVSYGDRVSSGFSLTVSAGGWA